MTEVVTVSAVTAAYAAEPLKASARVSGSAPAQEAMHSAAQEARKADSITQQQMNVVSAPALTLFFLTAGQQNRQLQQATFRQAEDAYLENHGEEKEEEQPEEEASGEDADEAAGEAAAAETVPPPLDPDAMFGEVREGEVLALPSPDSFG